MKYSLFMFLFVFLFGQCSPVKRPKQIKQKEKITCSEADKEILGRIFEQNKNDKKASAGTLMIRIGSFFEETPYVAHTLETDSLEKLTINLRGLDCTTFAENCLAISRAIRSGNCTFKRFASELKNIRYRDGIIDGYPSRLHYFSDWIYNNHQKKTIADITKNLSQTCYLNKVDFMSNHPNSYEQLKNNPSFISTIRQQEEEISSRKTWFVPKEIIGEVEEKLMDGDIVGITTNIKGLDILHVGLLIRKAGRIHLMHASSAAKKVVVSDNTLQDYLAHNKNATGIMVARPL